MWQRQAGAHDQTIVRKGYGNANYLQYHNNGGNIDYFVLENTPIIGYGVDDKYQNLTAVFADEDGVQYVILYNGNNGQPFNLNTITVQDIDNFVNAVNADPPPQQNPNQHPVIYNEGIRDLPVHKEEPMYTIKNPIRNQQKDMNSNIISLLESSKIPNQYGDVSQRNWFTNTTISRNPDTVFIFGGNVGHIQNRALGGGGQAAATAKQQNVLPIITTGNYTDTTQAQMYHQKIKNILQEYVQNGGKVVFPTKLATQADVDLLNREGYNVNIGDEVVNVGTGLAAGNYIAGTRAFAQHLFEELKKIPVQSMGKYGSCINYFHQQMNKLEVGFQKPTYKSEYLQQNQRKKPDDTNNNDKFTKIFNTLLAKNKFQRLTVEKIIKVFKDAEKWGSYTGYLKKYSYKRMKELFSNAKLKGMHRKEFTHEVRQIRNEYSTPQQRAFSVAFSKIKDNNGNNLSTSSFFQNFEGNTKQEKTHNMIKFIKNAVQDLRR